MLPLVELALNNAVHASTGCTPFYVNGLTHPRVPLTLPLRGSRLGGGEIADRLADVSPLTVRKLVDEFLSTRLSVLRHVRDAMANISKRNKRMLKAEAMLRVMRSGTSCCLKLSTYLHMQCPRSSRPICARASLDRSRSVQEGPSVYAQSSEEDAYTPRVLRWLAQAVQGPGAGGAPGAGARGGRATAPCWSLSNWSS
jgi:hypothetical protein